MRKLKSKKNLIIIALVAVVILGLGGTFAFFTFFKPVEAFVLTMDGMQTIQVEFKEGTNVIDNPYAYPISDSFAKENLAKLGYVDFTVKGEMGANEAVYYELYLTEENGNTLDSNFIKVYLTDDKNTEVEAPAIYSSLSPSTSEEHKSDGKILHSETITGQFEKTFRVYVWIDSTYSQNTEHQTFAFKVNLYAHNTGKAAALTFKEQIASHTTESCNPTVVDGDTIYFSGKNDCVNFNYVWYSGKLWRITAINPDNTMKMITQDAITAIYWGSNTTYKDSWIYQWLNEDFLDTLENQENIIVQDAKWNATADSSSTPAKPTGATIDGNVGLLNAYEYTQAYKNASASTNYLNIGYYWWLITPYSSSTVRCVGSDGYLNYNLLSSLAYGVRPSVNLKSDIKISGGAGTKENPYRIEGDKVVAQVNDKLNSRVSGEYVNFDGKKYRIVGIENETTKLTSVDYVRDADGAVMTKNFGSSISSVNYGGAGTTSTDYWAGYLNDTTASGWYGSISAEYKNMLVKGTYYLGTVGSNTSYKNAICSASNTTETTEKCSKTSSTWNNGYVGLPRVGEMFSAQLGEGSSSSSDIWLITPYDSSGVRFVSDNDALSGVSPSFSAYGVRPSINLKSDTLISGGEGTEQKPYELKVEQTEKPKVIATEALKAKIGSGGLIGVTNNNQKVETENGNEIREYRYSGANVNNYVKFNNEDWRIVGIFKDDKGQDHLKIAKSETLASMQWDSGDSNDWSKASLNTYLNGTYLENLDSVIGMIFDMKYYLGELTYDSTNHGVKENPVEAYEKETDKNAATWPGKIGLLYPSDYGLSTDSNYWDLGMNSVTFTSAAANSSWMMNSDFHTALELFITPFNYGTNAVVNWSNPAGTLNFSYASSSHVVRPTLYLNSDVTITNSDGDGSKNKPYILGN